MCEGLGVLRSLLGWFCARCQGLVPSSGARDNSEASASPAGTQGHWFENIMYSARANESVEISEI